MSFQLLLFDFSGRIGRKWFWIGTSCAFIFYVMALLFIGVVSGSTTSRFSMSDGIVFDLGSGGIVSMVGIGIVAFMSIYMQAAVSVKRFHDRGKSGWWALIGIVPYVGSIWIIVENGILAGRTGTNRFGPDPMVDPRAALDG